MGKPRRIVVEYLRTRRVLRMVNRAGAGADVVELPLAAFVDGLGLRAADLVQTPHYLLFAGTVSGPAGGLRDLLGAFAAEEKAREAFRGIRLSPAYRRGWAELVALQPGGRDRARVLVRSGCDQSGSLRLPHSRPAPRRSPSRRGATRSVGATWRSLRNEATRLRDAG